VRARFEIPRNVVRKKRKAEHRYRPTFSEAISGKEGWARTKIRGGNAHRSKRFKGGISNQRKTQERLFGNQGEAGVGGALKFSKGESTGLNGKKQGSLQMAQQKIVC